MGAATIQNFSGGFSRKTICWLGLLRGDSQSPVSRMDSTAYRVDRLVVVQIRPAEADEERNAEKRDGQYEPERAGQSLTQVTRDHSRGMFTFSIETG